MLLVGFGGLAVIIGAVGVYSLISYMVSWRTREIGLRLALGAQRWQIVMTVVRQSLTCLPEHRMRDRTCGFRCTQPSAA